MSTQIRIFQTHDQAGIPAQQEFSQQITPAATQTLPDAIMQFLRPLNPRLSGPLSQQPSEHTGVYWYSDPLQGSGWLRLEGAPVMHTLRVDELVRMEEISRSVGGSDPVSQPDVKYVAPLVIHNRNPNVQITLGIIFAAIGIAMSVAVLVSGTAPLFALIIIPIFGLIIIVAGIILARRGMKRLAWWRQARAQAIQDGGAIPEDLHRLG